MDEAEYPGIRVTMTTLFDGVRTPLKIDVSTGDAITSKEVRYSFKIAILQQLYGSTLDPHVLHDVLLATAHKRGTERHLAAATEVFDEVETSLVMLNLWAAYQKKFSYASDLDWNTAMAAVRQLFARCEGRYEKM